MANPDTNPSPPPWHAAFPSPRTTKPGSISRVELLNRLKQGQKPGVDGFLLIDLRRNDHEGGSIRGSLNLPAQSLWWSLPTVYALAKKAGVELLVWYCGSSGGRGTRAAGWMADLIEDRRDESMKSVILEGGIKGWASAGEEYVKWMDGYEEDVWKKVEKTKQ